MGFTEGDIEELAADQLAFAEIKEIVGSGVQVPEAESRENYERLRKAERLRRSPAQ